LGSALAGCDEGDPPLDASVDAAVITDAGSGDAGRDAGSAEDAATADAATTDAATTDAAIADASSGSDASGACHAYAFGAPAAAIRMVASLPAMTGGTIPLGTYDAIDAQTTSTIGGSYRATWVFEDATTLAQLQQITLTGPGAVVPRLFTWSTAGTTLTRAETCPGADSFSQTYRVRTEDGDTLLDVRQATLMFTFRLR
jgi:hypothetical protein